MKYTKNISEKLNSITLPQLPQVLVQLIDVCRSEEVDIRLVAQTVAQDIAITTKTLQLANSAFIGARSQFKNIDQAVIFLGVDTVRNLAISTSVHEVFGNSLKPNGFNCEQFWHHSLLTALISKEIAQKSGYDDPGAAYLTGLLHDTGKYLLSQHIGEPYQELLNQHSHDALVAAEKNFFEISHPDVCKWMLDKWNISEELGRAVRDHHNIDNSETETSILGRILRLANTLTKKKEVFDQQTIKDASILCISPSTLPVIVEEQTAALKDLAQTLGVHIQEPDSNVLSPEVQKDSQRLLGEKVEVRAQLYGFMDNIIQAKTINRVFLALEESLELLFNCNEIVLLLPDSGGTNFRAHGSFRNTIAKQLKVEDIVIPLKATFENEEGIQFNLSTLTIPTIISSPSAKSCLSPLYSAFNMASLLAVPIRIAQDSQGILFIALTSKNYNIVKKEETLQLLSNHVGNRLYQETLKEEYATNFAQERISVVEEIARSVAHEISSPLGVIQNYIALLAQQDGQTDQMNRDLSIINKEIERIASISKQLNNLSQTPEANDYEFVNVNELIMDMVSLYQNSITTDGKISIEYTLIPNLPLLWVEPNALKQILGNLITNSIEAIADSGTIEIHSHHIPESDSKRVGEIVIVVSDNGVGVPPSIANTIFRAGTTTKSNGHSGLGLTIVNKLTNDIGGRIFHSTGKQGRTLFNLHIPTLKPTS